MAKVGEQQPILPPLNFLRGKPLEKLYGVIGYVASLIGYKWILVKRGLFARHGQGREAWYGLPLRQGEQE